MTSTDFEAALASMSGAVASHMAAVTDSALRSAVVDGFVGRLWFRVTTDITASTLTMGVEFLRLAADAACPWPQQQCVYYEIDAAAYERIAAYAEGRTCSAPTTTRVVVT